MDIFPFRTYHVDRVGRWASLRLVDLLQGSTPTPINSTPGDLAREKFVFGWFKRANAGVTEASYFEKD